MTWLRFLQTPPTEELRPLMLPAGVAVPVRWVRDARARRLRLIVNDKGVRLTLPRRASMKLAEQFLSEHRDWLQAQLAKQPRIEAPVFSRDSDTVLLRDQHLAIDWREGRFVRVELNEHGIGISRSEKTTDRQLRSTLRDFYLQQARVDIGQWLPRYLPGLPSTPTAFKIRPLSSLWGSLSPSDALSLDLALVLGRPGAFEYVLVHELCHLIQRNHSRHFWQEVEKRWPGWREQRAYLHGDGLHLKATLRRLTLD